MAVHMALVVALICWIAEQQRIQPEIAALYIIRHGDANCLLGGDSI